MAKGKKIMTGRALFVFDPTVFKDDEDAAETKDLKEVVEGMVEEEAALNVGGKKWEAKKVVEKEAVEGDAVDEEEEQDAGVIAEEDGEDAEDIEVDEGAFADEEELPDEL